MTRIPTVDRRLLLDDRRQEEIALSEITWSRDWRIVVAAWLISLAFASLLLWIEHYLKKHCCPREIPVAAVRGSGRVTGLPAPLVSDECSICLGEFLDGERIRVLPKCNHEFHVWCIDKWLALHATCPNCRRRSVAGGGLCVSAAVPERGGGDC
ncbi:RING-H2 finger protein ATL74 [Linum perenne]